MPGWTNLIVVEYLTAIGQRYIQLPGLTRAQRRNTITNRLAFVLLRRTGRGVEPHHLMDQRIVSYYARNLVEHFVRESITENLSEKRYIIFNRITNKDRGRKYAAPDKRCYNIYNNLNCSLST